MNIVCIICPIIGMLCIIILYIISESSNKALKNRLESRKLLEKMYTDRIHELYVENEKYMLAVNKVLFIIKEEQFKYKTAYNLSDNLDDLFNILWTKYGSKDPDKQEARPYKSVSEMVDEACSCSNSSNENLSTHE